MALIAHAIAGAPNTATTTGVNTTGANFLSITINCYNVTGPALIAATITDTYSNTWIACTPVINGGEANTIIFFAYNAIVGTGHSVSVTLTANFPGIVFGAYSGVKSSGNPLDQQNGATSGAGATSVQPGSITPSVSGCLIISSLGQSGGGFTGLSVNSGFTVADSMNYSSGVNESNAQGYLIQSVAAPINPTWSTATSTIYSSAIASFLPGFTAYTKSLSETYTLAETFAKLTRRTVSEVYTLAETFKRAITISPSEVFTLVETEINVGPHGRKALADSLTILDFFIISLLRDPSLRYYRQYMLDLTSLPQFNQPPAVPASSGPSDASLDFYRRYLGRT